MGEIRRPADLRGSRLPFSYVVVDTETTGLDHNRDELLEIGAVKVVNGNVVDQFDTFVCAKRINQKAAQINGITRAMVKDAPSADDAVSMFVEFAGDFILLAHNATFDKSFIESVRKLPNDWIDTLDFAKIVMPGGRGGRKLSDLCERYGVQNESSHRALSDCMATHQCYLGMVKELVSRSDDPRDIIVLEDMRYLAPDICGKSFAISGEKGTSKRHKILQAVANCGGSLHQSVTLKTDYLIVLGDTCSQKYSKAKEYADRGTGIKILNLDGLLAMMPPSVAEPLIPRQAPSAAHAPHPCADRIAEPISSSVVPTPSYIDDDFDYISYSRTSDLAKPRSTGNHFSESKARNRASRKTVPSQPLWKRIVGAVVFFYAVALGITFFFRMPEFFNNDSGFITNAIATIVYFCFVALIAHIGSRLLFGKGYISKLTNRQ